VVHVLIVNMILFIKMSNFLMQENICIMAFSVVYWDTLDDDFCILVCKRTTLSILMARVMCLRFNMQEEDVFEHIHHKCQLYTLLVNL
jgi:hypothetical protein